MFASDHIPVRQRLLNGERILNGFCTIGSTITAEVMARLPFGALTVDMQHGLTSYEQALSMLQVMQAHRKSVLCRVSQSNAGEILRALNAGFEGIICPGVETAEDASRFVAATMYPPIGTRCFGAARAAEFYGSAYAADTAQLLVRFVAVGSLRAVENLDSILAVEGLDGVYIATSDLSLSLGMKPTQSLHDPRISSAVTEIVARARKRGKLVGIHSGSPDAAREALTSGFNLVSVMTDLRIYAYAMKDAVQKALPA